MGSGSIRTIAACLVLLALRVATAQEFTAAPIAEPLIAPGATWKLFRGIAEPSGGTLAWAEVAFADASWDSGPAGFGYGDDDDATILADMRNRYTTVYLRRTFTVASPADAGRLDLEIDFDDGFVAYLNGREVARANAGAAGSRPAHDATATASHEAGTPERISLGEGAELLVAGENVLAVVGLNAAIDGGDFSLHPRLLTADFAGEGCPGDFYVSGGRATISGSAPIPQTASVRVDGHAADLDRGTGRWTYRAPLVSRVATWSAEALDAGGTAIASVTLRLVRVRTLEGELADGTTLEAASGPFVAVSPLTLSAGRKLRIEPGCELYFLPAIGLRIEGEIDASGTSAAPIRFGRLPCGANWGHFELLASPGANRFRFCEWSFATGAPGCLRVMESHLEMESCVIRDIDGEGVHATDSTTRIRRCLTERTKEALSLDRGDTLVEYCTVRDVVGKSDLIDCNGSVDPPPRLRFNLIYGTSDDGIDADGSSIFAEWNVIHDCGDQAFSLVGAGASQISHNVCYRNGVGLSVKDAHVCTADFNTFALSTVSGVRAIEKTAGRGGGVITLRSSIVWGNVLQLLVDHGGSIDATHCDVEGGGEPGTGNFGLDPLFVDAATGAFQLGPASPCIGVAPDGSDIGALPFESAPRAPSGLVAVSQGFDAAWLSWQDNSAVETSFEIERAVSDGPFLPLVSLPAGTLVHADAGLAAGTTHQYRVRARNDDGASAWSEAQSIRTDPLPAPVLLGIEPASGPTRGGTDVTIGGRNLVGRVSAKLGGAALVDIVDGGEEEVTGRTPPGSRGIADLVLSTPGGEAVLAGAFTYYDAHARGDFNGDEALDLADVLAELGYLFRSGPAPPCTGVADVNGDGDVDLSDPLFLLFHLFAGGRPPAAGEARCF